MADARGCARHHAVGSRQHCVALVAQQHLQCAKQHCVLAGQSLLAARHAVDCESLRADRPRLTPAAFSHWPSNSFQRGCSALALAAERMVVVPT